MKNSAGQKVNCLWHPNASADRFELLPGVHGASILPQTVIRAGADASKAFWEYFTAQICSKNTRCAYARQIAKFFRWCEAAGLELELIEPHHVG